MSIDEKLVSDKLPVSMVHTWALGIVGAVLGGAAGWFICSLMYQSGFYALALPGAGIGLGFATLARRTMILGGIFCAVAALIVSILWEGFNRPFVADESLSFFFSNLHQLEPPTWLFLVLGTVIAFWFGRGR